MQDIGRQLDGQLLTWDDITALVDELRNEQGDLKESLLVQLLMTVIQHGRFDALTGLYNRRYLMEGLTREMARAQRYAVPLSILLLDLDHFKRINDTYGHLMGDTVLETIGTLLRDTLRAIDIPGRYGGEEFCVVLPETPMEDACLLAERIRQRVAAAVFQAPGGLPVAITCSIGVAQLREGPRDIAAMLEDADRALYQAKASGRNRVMVAQTPA